MRFSYSARYISIYDAKYAGRYYLIIYLDSKYFVFPWYLLEPRSAMTPRFMSVLVDVLDFENTNKFSIRRNSGESDKESSGREADNLQYTHIYSIST